MSESVAGVIWRWRAELLGLIVVLLVVGLLVHVVGMWPAVGVLVGVVTVVFGVPWSRRFLVARVWCVVSRHRLQRLFFEESRLHTRTGRVPLILWTRPTTVGERAVVWCRAGVCAEDLDASIDVIRTACYARDARTTRHQRWSQLVTVDIVRRDPLAATELVSSVLVSRN